jgi:hypothetical protein
MPAGCGVERAVLQRRSGRKNACLPELIEQLEERRRRGLKAGEAKQSRFRHVVHALEGAAEIAVRMPPGSQPVDLRLGQRVSGCEALST